MVIDHDCRDYVQRYCDGRALRAYVAYYDSDVVTPWGLVSIVCSFDARVSGWEEFIVGDMKAKLGRFGDIMVDPSIVQ